MALAPSPADGPASRPIVPRRPQRRPATRDKTTPDTRRPLAALNIFADLYDPEPEPACDSPRDPRVAASRRRARLLLGLAPHAPSGPEANFWHPEAEAEPVAAPGYHAAATIAANDMPHLPLPLQDQLARVRTALYDHGLDDDARLLESPSTQLRLASCAMNATLVVVAFPVGAAVTAYSLIRGSDIRLSAQAMAIVAAITGVWQSGIGHLL